MTRALSRAFRGQREPLTLARTVRPGGQAVLIPCFDAQRRETYLFMHILEQIICFVEMPSGTKKQIRDIDLGSCVKSQWMSLWQRWNQNQLYWPSMFTQTRNLTLVEFNSQCTLKRKRKKKLNK